MGFPASFHPLKPGARTATRVYPASTARPAAVCEDVQSRLEKNGVIAGAKLLSSFDHYDIQKELPADKNAPLVFYCSNRL